MAGTRANSADGRRSAEGLGADLHLDHLDLRGRHGLRTSLMDALREAVRSGRLLPGALLPSSRTLAADLSIARNTVADAYAELVAEGWLTSRQGSGTRVARRAEPRRAPAPGADRVPLKAPSPIRTPDTKFSLLPGNPDLASFPRAQWLAAARRAIMAAPHEALGYGDPRGRVELRTALADYLARARGVYASPERIVICAGFVHGLRLIGSVLRARGVRTVAVETYGVPQYYDLLTETGLVTPALSLDEDGTRTEELNSLDAGAVVLTPAHQYPTGGALRPGRRAAVVDWARTTGGLVLEDDYDGEFRYDRQPVGALQGLDPERVCYFGTASKSLAPGLRLGWLVLPRSVTHEVIAAKGHVDWAPGSFDQLALAEFLTSGDYDRHVRAMRLRYRRRRDQLVAAVAEHAPAIRVSGIAAGLHAVLDLPPGTERATIAAGVRAGVALVGLGDFAHPSVRENSGRDGLVVGYATPSDSAWSGALAALCSVLPR
ncbi:PLP-dependent aminotransferase family protein [Amycolatopsis rhabdoformis]|uniref:PLP-dependent aminotransferase family protein n=1 Tax=Amycolatopsis rhabdoformis TaxID=1448059 RepID=A0ABZ1HXE1_9PSEU|nr:PLP-dependent aminotransferase family protein [Amycolatopsis rhabdoformis]WSE26806.1 PLP-dependent aminotransferase family protein [Amycolatopsis rhabdoformis]